MYLVACSTYTNTDILAHTPKGEQSTRGIECFWLDGSSGKLRPAGGVDVGPNPAFILQHPTDPEVIYASTERIDENGSIHSLRLVIDDGSVELRPVDEIDAEGKSTCYMSVDKSGSWLRVTNYWDASVIVAPVAGARLGELAEKQVLPPASLLENTKFKQRCERPASYCDTHSPSREEHWSFRQRWPHAHCVVTEPYDAKAHFVVDLGEDAIYACAFDDALGKLVCRGATTLERGVGPRHIVFHATKRCAFVVNELVSTVSAFVFNADAPSGSFKATEEAATLRLCGTSTTLPASYDNAHRVCPNTGIWKAKSHAAEIRIDGDWLFVANRGHDSIAVFKIEFENDEPKLVLLRVNSTMGKCPRNFAIAGEHIIVGNQDSNELRVFQRCETGELRSVSTLPQKSPNFLTILKLPPASAKEAAPVESSKAGAAAVGCLISAIAISALVT